MGAGIHSASDVEGRASSTMHLLRVLLLAHGSRSEGAGPPRARRCKGANDVPRFREEGSSCRFQYDTWHTGGYATGSLQLVPAAQRPPHRRSDGNAYSNSRHWTYSLRLLASHTQTQSTNGTWMKATRGLAPASAQKESAPRTFTSKRIPPRSPARPLLVMLRLHAPANLSPSTRAYSSSHE